MSRASRITFCLRVGPSIPTHAAQLLHAGLHALSVSEEGRPLVPARAALPCGGCCPVATALTPAVPPALPCRPLGGSPRAHCCAARAPRGGGPCLRGRPREGAGRGAAPGRHRRRLATRRWVGGWVGAKQDRGGGVGHTQAAPAKVRLCATRGGSKPLGLSLQPLLNSFCLPLFAPRSCRPRAGDRHWSAAAASQAVALAAGNVRPQRRCAALRCGWAMVAVMQMRCHAASRRGSCLPPQTPLCCLPCCSTCALPNLLVCCPECLLPNCRAACCLDASRCLPPDCVLPAARLMPLQCWEAKLWWSDALKRTTQKVRSWGAMSTFGGFFGCRVHTWCLPSPVLPWAALQRVRRVWVGLRSALPLQTALEALPCGSVTTLLKTQFWSNQSCFLLQTGSWWGGRPARAAGRTSQEAVRRRRQQALGENAGDGSSPVRGSRCGLCFCSRCCRVRHMPCPPIA